MTHTMRKDRLQALESPTLTLDQLAKALGLEGRLGSSALAQKHREIEGLMDDDTFRFGLYGIPNQELNLLLDLTSLMGVTPADLRSADSNLRDTVFLVRGAIVYAMRCYGGLSMKQVKKVGDQMFGELDISRYYQVMKTYQRFEVTRTSTQKQCMDKVMFRYQMSKFD